jgi:hypothetical protein
MKSTGFVSDAGLWSQGSDLRATAAKTVIHRCNARPYQIWAKRTVLLFLKSARLPRIVVSVGRGHGRAAFPVWNVALLSLMHLVEIFLPLKDNRGRPFADEKYAAVREHLTERFGGLTAFSRSPAQGTTWDGGKRVHDEIIVFEVMTETLDISWWGVYQLQLEREFRQDGIVVRASTITLLWWGRATKDIDQLFLELANSPFRRRFRLRPAELRYLERKGLNVVLAEAADLLSKRLGAANPPNDGKQTPFKGHPMFIAQHATATCCRGCPASGAALKWAKL